MPTQTLKVGVIGASGYTGGELLRLLVRHPYVKITTVTADKSAGTSLGSIFPHLHSMLSHKIEPTNLTAITKQIDVVFLALPHTKSMEPVKHFVNAGKIVLDLSADFRLHTPATYQTWYQVAHTAPELLSKAVYGLPELYRSKIQKSRFIAVPGCYATTALLQLAPLMVHRLIQPRSIIIDAKSGISGAGRTPALLYHFPEAHESVKAYKIGEHRHTPEIEQELHKLYTSKSPTGKKTGVPGKVTFTPHLVPINRGILSTAYARPLKSTSLQELRLIYREFYKGEPFIRLHDDPLAINPSYIRGSNFCDMGIFLNTRTNQIVSVATLDNLVKGAAGQAIQAMNLIAGFSEDLGLTMPGTYP